MYIGKDFDLWNLKKKTVHRSERITNLFYHERDVWWCAIGVNVGVETDGKHGHFERPVLVVRKFNKNMFWGVPLTSQERIGKFYDKVECESGISYVMLSQMRTWSSKRLSRKFGVVSRDDFHRIQGRLRGFLHY